MISVLRKIRTAGRRAALAFSRRGLVLLYHRVAEPGTDPQALCVSPAHFAEHAEILKRRSRPSRLGALCKGARDGGLASGSVAVTFDDGYKDNLDAAKPILERHGVPATVYVTTGQVGTGREFWWDEVERRLLGAGGPEGELVIEIGGRTLRWDMGDGPSSPDGDGSSARGWNVLVRGFPSRRYAVYLEVMRLLHGASGPEREKAIAGLAGRYGPGPGPRGSHLCMGPEELVLIAKDGLVELGAHTVTHPVLSALNRGAQEEEVRLSRTRIEDITGRGVESFSYPFGNQGSYTRETVDVVRDAGFRNACANFAGVVVKGTDVFQLPRFIVRDWDGDVFLRNLRDWGLPDG